MSRNNRSKLNLNFYTGDDKYSDGDIENEILNIVKENKNINEVIYNDDRWPILYHLSPIRRNLLEWIDFPESNNVLEIGAGCGALTGLLCEKFNTVKAIELSKRRAEIIINRYPHHNLEVIVGDFNEINIDEKFDVITLIGVLEYAAKFSVENNPYFSFLKSIYDILKPGGTLIIAIENKFGLKYWAGAPEDHTRNLYEGIENYNRGSGIKTFSKTELNDLLTKANFTDNLFYYPMPDYKLPNQIFSDSYLPSIGDINGFFPNYDAPKIQMLNEKMAFNNIISNNQFPFFANSFLVVCRKV